MSPPALPKVVGDEHEPKQMQADGQAANGDERCCTAHKTGQMQISRPHVRESNSARQICEVTQHKMWGDVHRTCHWFYALSKGSHSSSATLLGRALLVPDSQATSPPPVFTLAFQLFQTQEAWALGEQHKYSSLWKRLLLAQDPVLTMRSPTKAMWATSHKSKAYISPCY